jgi:hypothetical protein
MASRDGLHFKRWSQPVIPENAPADRKGNRSNYMTWGLLQLPDQDEEYSVYATEAYYTGPDSRVRRFTYRVDGFVSARAGQQQGHLLTQPLIFKGQQLELNLKTSESGLVAVEIQDIKGKPIPGFSLKDCQPCSGDSIASRVTWKSYRPLRTLAGQPVRLRFTIQNGDLYSFQFTDRE